MKNICMSHKLSIRSSLQCFDQTFKDQKIHCLEKHVKTDSRKHVKTLLPPSKITLDTSQYSIYLHIYIEVFIVIDIHFTRFLVI